MQLTRGEFVWIAESDDDAVPNFLATLMGNAVKGSMSRKGTARRLDGSTSLSLSRLQRMSRQLMQAGLRFWPIFVRELICPLLAQDSRGLEASASRVPGILQAGNPRNHAISANREKSATMGPFPLLKLRIAVL